MRNLSKILLVSSLTAMMIASCKKDENKVYFEGGTAPVLTASSTTPMVLDPANKEDLALTFSWTNPDYRFNTGVSSQDVAYTLQVGKAGSNFSGTAFQEMVIANDLSVPLKVKDVNSFLTKMELASAVAHDIEFRIKSSLANGSVPLYSNVIKITITPYLDFAVEPPGTFANNYEDGNLWVVGDCFLSPNWTNPVPAPYDVTLKFTKITKLRYELVADFDAAGGYKLIQEQGVWSSQYHALTAGAPLSGEFEKRDADPQFASPGVGRYKIEVNFQTGKYQLTLQ
jgi:starch-binding outer membrane protein SusE/F